ncbi:hypothetical protein HNR46_003206 [Haloferula luteola]|uniref:Uncharacterized protein n=1 Tax=Haloferula luteola TaxID=595692 RepID=A0A840V7E2_9BACT|nr:hypothetical protein [Haloferula luteola]MBB5352956.1 hypothetical protein [Haloferula luteola]
MNRRSRNKVLAFACGLILASSLGAWIRRAKAKSPEELPRTVLVRSERWDERDFLAKLATLEPHKDPADLCRTMERLPRPPMEALPGLLASIHQENGSELTLAAKYLLIRWAEVDGEQAMSWAWSQWPNSRLWELAFREVGAAWAWADPSHFARWVLAHPQPRGFIDSEEEIDPAGPPVLVMRDWSQAVQWLLEDHPRLAFEVLLGRGGYQFQDDSMWRSLTRPEQIIDALSAFGPLEDLDWESQQENKGMYAHALLRRWQEMDPESFGKSGNAQWLSRRSDGLFPEELAKWREARDKVAAGAAALEGVENSQRLMLVGALLREWGQIDPDAALEWGRTLGDREGALARATWFRDQVAETPGAALDQVEREVPEERWNFRVQAFDAWKHPMRPGDFEAWPEERRRTWESLEALQAVGTRP